jgi:hypothetical protein
MRARARRDGISPVTGYTFRHVVEFPTLSALPGKLHPGYVVTVPAPSRTADSFRRVAIRQLRAWQRAQRNHPFRLKGGGAGVNCGRGNRSIVAPVRVGLRGDRGRGKACFFAPRWGWGEASGAALPGRTRSRRDAWQHRRAAGRRPGEPPAPAALSAFPIGAGALQAPRWSRGGRLVELPRFFFTAPLDR